MCLDKNPLTRIDADQALAHPFLNRLGYSTVESGKLTSKNLATVLLSKKINPKVLNDESFNKVEARQQEPEPPLNQNVQEGENLEVEHIDRRI